MTDTTDRGVPDLSAGHGTRSPSPALASSTPQPPAAPERPESMSSDPSAISVDETAVMTAVGAAIIARRTELKISQQALARTVGTSRTFLRGIEAGERAPTVVTLTRIARALHTTPSALITTIR
ncbi:helix-turn-helix domain-containing protein [Gordonia hongkongensis]|uniref:Helix-turn-helix domain-containing protein n=1 Tax=Gordonia hongkongensis TaxID=1701090 RepID=A0ABT6BYE4_9ACTN|nr:helix-turn-helix transcriptional regulator [Gordonia hongkongensis]MDF6103092.1 helix-turn-helix domain-containing protein [Gordonia hongkongensis]